MDLKEVMFILNPFYPLKFERLGTGDPKLSPPELKRDLMNCHVGVGAYEFPVDVNLYANESVHEAESLCDDYQRGLGCANDEEAASIAERALSISPMSATALTMLGQFKAETFGEALDFLEKAEIAAKEMVKGGIDFESVYKTKECWLTVIYRPYFRALHNKANTLLKMGKAKAAYTIFKELFRLDPNIHMSSNYANFKVPALAACVLTNQWNIVDKFMRMGAMREQFDMQSSQVAYTWTAAYVLHKTRGPQGMDTKFYDHFIHKKPYKLDSDAGVLLALFNGPYFYKFMTGEAELPDLPVPRCYRHARTPSNSAVMFKYFGALWMSDPSALEWAERNVNTAFFHCFVNHDPQLESNTKQVKEVFNAPDLTLKTFEKFCGKVYPNASVPSGIPLQFPLVLDVAVAKHTTPQHLRAMLKAGFNPNVNTGKVDCPLNFCAFHGLNEQVGILLEFGADPTQECAFSGCTGIEVACNQANAQALKLMFKHNRKLRNNQTVIRGGLSNLFGTSVYECIAMPSNQDKRCQRCQGGTHSWFDHGHTRDLRDFERCAALLLDHGLKVTPSVKAECTSYIHKGPLWKFLTKYGGKKSDLAQIMADLKI